MAEIKIRELSIGDWVEIDGEPAEALCLRIAGGHIFKGVSGQMYRCCGGMDFKPIALTPEILEKNGFVKNGEYDEWNIGTWNTPYLLGVSLERPAITIKWNGSSIFIDHAKYVHQLQNALRLAGVEKEIIIQ